MKSEVLNLLNDQLLLESLRELGYLKLQRMNWLGRGKMRTLRGTNNCYEKKSFVTSTGFNSVVRTIFKESNLTTVIENGSLLKHYDKVEGEYLVKKFNFLYELTEKVPKHFSDEDVVELPIMDQIRFESRNLYKLLMA